MDISLDYESDSWTKMEIILIPSGYQTTAWWAASPAQAIR
jgi:hypothetical protein